MRQSAPDEKRRERAGEQRAIVEKSDLYVFVRAPNQQLPHSLVPAFTEVAPHFSTNRTNGRQRLLLLLMLLMLMIPLLVPTIHRTLCVCVLWRTRLVPLHTAHRCVHCINSSITEVTSTTSTHDPILRGRKRKERKEKRLESGTWLGTSIAPLPVSRQ